MDWVFVIAAALSAWAVLTVMGNERQRTHEAAAAQTPPDAPPAAAVHS